ncbi:MAG: alkaline phosphatase family protein [Candidatus Cybelea sp.]
MTTTRPNIRYAITSLAVAWLALLFSACNANAVTAGVPGGLRGEVPSGTQTAGVARRGSSSGKIQHVVIVIQENRSFNDLFYGFKGAKTARYGYDTNGDKIKIKPVVLETTWDLEHSSIAFFADCNGTGSIPGTNCQMNGFNNEGVACGKSSYGPCPIEHPQYAYVPHSETKPYFEMAKQYVLADQMYSSVLDGSFTSHQYIIAGQSESAVNWPNVPWGCPGGSGDKVTMLTQQRAIQGYEVPCWDTTTLGDELDGKGISWAYYAAPVDGSPGVWSAYQVIKHIYDGYDWNKDVISPPSQFLTDVSNGNLRAVSWVTPTAANSDHPGSGSKTGPSWVASVVNAIGESQYWDSTAIFVFWDDWGGWYDPEPPAYVDYDGLGIRVPMIVISAYAKKGHVSHVPYEHGSILKFVEDQFGLGRLAASDTRATSPEQDCFNFNQSPRQFTPISSPRDKAYFLHQPSDYRLPDDE